MSQRWANKTKLLFIALRVPWCRCYTFSLLFRKPFNS